MGTYRWCLPNNGMLCSDIDDLRDVIREVKPLTAQWRQLCNQLGIKENSLDVVEHNYPRDADMCLYKALVEWLKQNYDHQRHGKPSWRKLAEVIWSLDRALFQTVTEAHFNTD